jgi:hypothetical protein
LHRVGICETRCICVESTVILTRLVICINAIIYSNSIRDFAAVDGCMDSSGGNGGNDSSINLNDHFRHTGDSASSRRSINNMLTSDDGSSDDDNNNDNVDTDTDASDASDCTR